MVIKTYKGILKLKKVGTSLGFLVSKDIREYINIIEGDYVGVKLYNIDSIIHNCPHCEGEIKLMKGGTKQMVEKNTAVEEAEETEAEETDDEEAEDKEAEAEDKE